MKTQLPFYFALPTGCPVEVREKAPAHVAEKFGLGSTKVEFVRAEPRFRLYRIAAAS